MDLWGIAGNGRIAKRGGGLETLLPPLANCWGLRETSRRGPDGPRLRFGLVLLHLVFLHLVLLHAVVLHRVFLPGLLHFLGVAFHLVFLHAVVMLHGIVFLHRVLLGGGLLHRILLHGILGEGCERQHQHASQRETAQNRLHKVSPCRKG